MRLLGRPKLEKLKKKRKGDRKLLDSIGQLIVDLESFGGEDWHSLKQLRPDADRVHNEGFYFFDIVSFRVLTLIEFDEQMAEVIWVGGHDDYERTFKE